MNKPIKCIKEYYDFYSSLNYVVNKYNIIENNIESIDHYSFTTYLSNCFDLYNGVFIQFDKDFIKDWQPSGNIKNIIELLLKEFSNKDGTVTFEIYY
jgi:hypothetical protein